MCPAGKTLFFLDTLDSKLRAACSPHHGLSPVPAAQPPRKFLHSPEMLKLERNESAQELESEKLTRSESRVLLNKNTIWLSDSGSWTFYLTVIFLSYCCASALVDAGLAWTYTHLAHSAVTFYFFHWSKGSPFQEDQVWLLQSVVPLAPSGNILWSLLAVCMQNAGSPLNVELVPEITLPGTVH